MPARMRIRGTAYAGVSVALAGIVILKALAQRPNFFSAAVYLSQSSANLMILTNMMFVLACTFMFGLQKLLYGPLRPIEIEQLYEKAWFAVTETCLAMTIFRGDIGPWFLIMFFALLAGKVWQWIGEGRVEILEQQPPRSPRLFHTRMALSLGIGIFFSMTMLEYVVEQVMRMPKPDMMVMFGFEFAVLSLLSISTAARYAIQLVEIGIVREQKSKRSEEMRKERIEAAKKDLEEAERPEPAAQDGEPAANGSAEPTTRPSIENARAALRQAEQPVDDNEVEVEGWEGKGRWVFYLDLTTDFFKLVLYLSFFIILLVFFGLPIHIMRDVFLTCRSFFKRISDFIKYRTATRDMNARYPDATVEEIGREDVCIICREEMRPYQPPGEGVVNPVAERMRPKKLPCGHVLHFACLRSWLERQQVCPTCRRSVVPTAQGANATGAAGAAPGQHPPGDRPVARVWQLGPLRIGVGAARGENMFEELQQQMQNDRAAAPAQPGQRNLQQYQFGIRWDGRRRRRHADPGTVRDQLDSVGRQLQAEAQALGENTQAYGIWRNAQLQMELLRAQQQQQAAAAAPTGATATGAQVQPPPPIPAAAMPPGAAMRTQSLQPIPGERTLQAGSENLPAGMTLPEGWSMMPLRPTAPGLNYSMPMANPFPQPHPAPQALHGHFAGTMPVPEHIRAMFSGMPGQPNPQIHQHLQAHLHNHQAAHTTQQPTPVNGQQPPGGQANGLPTQAPTTQRQTAEQLFQPWQDQLNALTASNNARLESDRRHHSTQTQRQRPSGSQPAQENASNATHHPAQEREAIHEAWLRTMQNPGPSANGSVVSPQPVRTEPQESPSINGTGSEAQTSPNAPTTNGAPADPIPQPLPSWGSETNAPAEVVRNGEAVNNTTTAEPQSSQRKAKPATVENLVEDPD